MTTVEGPAAANMARVPRSRVDDVFVKGEPLPEVRIGVATILSIEGDTCTVTMLDEEISGVVWLGRYPPPVGLSVELESRGDLLVVPEAESIDAYLEGSATDAAHVVSDEDPGDPAPVEVNLGGSMRDPALWEFDTDANGWRKEAADAGGLRVWQEVGTLQATNLLPNPSFENGTTTWSPVAATLTDTTDRAVYGLHSCLTTWTGGAGIVTTPIPATYGGYYTLSAHLFIPTGSPDVHLTVDGVILGTPITDRDAWVWRDLPYIYAYPDSDTYVGYRATSPGPPGDSLAVAYPAAPVVSTNLFTNPSFETGSPGWAAVSGSTTPAVSTEQAWVGAQSLKTQRGAGTSALVASRTITSQLLNGAGSYSYAIRVFIPAGTPTTGNTGIRVSGAGTTLQDKDTDVRDAWVTITGTFVWDGVGAVIVYSLDSAITAGYTAYLDGLHFVAGTTPPATYFDGDTPDTAFDTYAWSATAHASTSTHTRVTSTLTLHDATDFTPTGGELQIDSEVATYSAADTTTLTLTAPLVGSYPVDEPVSVYPNPNPPATCYVDALVLRQTAEPLPPGKTYFDGSLPAEPEATFEWTGTANASTSRWYDGQIGSPGDATLWGLETLDVAPGDQMDVSFTVAINAGSSTVATVRLLMLYGTDPATDPDSTLDESYAYGSVVPIPTTDPVTTQVQFTVPDTLSISGDAPATARVGLLFTGDADSDLLVSSVTALQTGSWAIGSVWLNPTAGDALPTAATVTQPSGSANVPYQGGSTWARPTLGNKAMVKAPVDCGGLVYATYTVAVRPGGKDLLSTVQFGSAVASDSPWVIVAGLVTNPVGVVQAYAGSTPPAGWLLCNGGTFSSLTYPDLAAVVGDVYGVHSGTTYYLPDLRRRFVWGADAAGGALALGFNEGQTTVTSRTPSHTHSIAGATTAGNLTAATGGGQGNLARHNDLLDHAHNGVTGSGAQPGNVLGHPNLALTYMIAAQPNLQRITVIGHAEVAAGTTVEVWPAFQYSADPGTALATMRDPALTVLFIPNGVEAPAGGEPALMSFWDGDSWRVGNLLPADVTETVNAAEAAPGATTVSLAVSSNDVRDGDYLTLTATVGPGGSIAGTVRFERSPDGSAWSTLATVAVVSSNATYNYTASGKGQFSFRAVFVGTPTNASSTSAAVPVKVRQLVAHTEEVTSDWHDNRTFKGNDDYLETSTLWQGTWGLSVGGNAKSLVMIDPPADLLSGVDVTVTMVRFKGRVDQWYKADNRGTLVVGWHEQTTPPATWPSGKVHTDLSRFERGGGTFSLNITSWAAAAVLSPDFHGITLGPGPSDASQYAGSIDGTTSAAVEPSLQVDWTAWEWD